LAVAAEELAPVFTPRVFRWKTGGFALPRRRFKSGDWLHFQSVDKQWIEEARAAVDTKTDTNLARMPESCQNAVRVPPVAANAFRTTADMPADCPTAKSEVIASEVQANRISLEKCKPTA